MLWIHQGRGEEKRHMNALGQGRGEVYVMYALGQGRGEALHVSKEEWYMLCMHQGRGGEKHCMSVREEWYMLCMHQGRGGLHVRNHQAEQDNCQGTTHDIVRRVYRQLKRNAQWERSRVLGMNFWVTSSCLTGHKSVTLIAIKLR